MEEVQEARQESSSFKLQQEVHGNKTLVVSVEGSTARLAGAEGIKKFYELVRDGSIIPQDTTYTSPNNLFGNIHSTLKDFDNFHRRQLLTEGLDTAACQQYLPRLRQALHNEYARWAAHGGAISLALESKQLAWWAVSAVLLGLDDPLSESVLESVNAWLSHCHDTNADVKDPEEHREQILEHLIRPSYEASRQRTIDDPSVTTCVLDALVASKLPQVDIEAELLYIIVDTLPRVERVFINSITAFCVYDEVHKKLLAAREKLSESWKTPDERWEHTEDLGYIDWFLREVDRFYYPKPAGVRGLAIKDVVLDDTNVREVVADLSSEWRDANLFNPDRYEGVEDYSRALNDDLVQLVTRGAFVMLLDFAWKMIPLQDYKLDASGAPVDRLMAVGFRRRANTEWLFEEAGSKEDWTFLRHPEATIYKNDIASLTEYFTDKRLDLWTHTMVQFIAAKVLSWKPLTAADITIPKERKELPKIKLSQTDIEILMDDEDLPLDPWYQMKPFEFIRDQFPFVDNFTDTWSPGEKKEKYVMKKLGKLWPRNRVHWDDRASDRGLELFVFHGMAQHLVEKLPDVQDDGSYYLVALDFMHVLEVRPGYAKYGADAYFDRDGHPIKIVRHGTTYRPGDDDWEYAKMCFRGSVLVKVTVVDHLLWLHDTVSNYLTTGSREQLPPDHPIRRLIKPFTFRSVVVSHEGSWILFWPKGALHRACALTQEGLKQTWDYGIGQFKMETFPEQITRQNIDTITTPFHQDGMDYWTTVRAFVEDYVRLYYQSDEQLQEDEHLPRFWSYLQSKKLTENRELTLENLIDVLAQSFMWITGLHNHLGCLGEYVTDPDFCPLAWVEGELASRPGTAVRTALILAGTNVDQPSLLEDFSHVMLDDNAKEICHRFNKNLRALSSSLSERNSKRIHSYVAFDPTLIELSASF